ncbi:MAG: flagellar hook capping FlgD N-terminal domain-containing protein [Terricaulis silvestris]
MDQNTINTINTNNASAITTNSNGATALSQLGDNFNTFLTLLTAQLQNQDPMSPMDSNQFTQQLVQFSQVEQQIQTNDNLKTLISSYQTSTSGTALSYLGKDAILQSSDTTLSNGVANWAYAFDKAPSEATLSVEDAQGHIVYSQDGDATTGNHLFSWNGQQTNGSTAPAGVYSLVVTAKDSTGASVDSTITTRETIMGVDFSSSSPQVLTASGSHDISDVKTIIDASAGST